VSLDIEMIIKGIVEDKKQWLMFVWAFDKNFIGPRNRSNSVNITFEQLFGLVVK
jgi:hypothetical protein